MVNLMHFKCIPLLYFSYCYLMVLHQSYWNIFFTSLPTSLFTYSSISYTWVVHLHPREVISRTCITHLSGSSPHTIKFPVPQNNIQALETLPLPTYFIFTFIGALSFLATVY